MSSRSSSLHASSSKPKMVPFPNKSHTQTQGCVSPRDSLQPDTFGAQSPLQYDDKGRQKRFVENLEQRRQRVEFLRRKEWTRRIAAWIGQSDNGNSQDPTYTSFSWEDFFASQEHDAGGRADSSDGWDDSEPYVIYTASPRSPSSSTSSLVDPPSPSRSISRPVSSSTPTVRVRWTPHSRHSSLTSISEEDEEKFIL